MRTTKGGKKDHRKREKGDNSKLEEMKATNTLAGRRQKMKNNRKMQEKASSSDGRYLPRSPQISTLLNQYCFSLSTGEGPWLLSMGLV